MFTILLVHVHSLCEYNVYCAPRGLNYYSFVNSNFVHVSGIRSSIPFHLHCRYNYPYFGSSAPVVVQPPTPLVVGAEHHFAAAYSAFKFASGRNKLVQQLHLQPLSLEVWASAEQSDSLVGVARVSIYVHVHIHVHLVNTFVLYICIHINYTTNKLYNGTMYMWSSLLITTGVTLPDL